MICLLLARTLLSPHLGILGVLRVNTGGDTSGGWGRGGVTDKCSLSILTAPADAAAWLYYYPSIESG